MQFQTRSPAVHIGAACGALVAAVFLSSAAVAVQSPGQPGAPAAAPRPVTSPFRQQRASTKAENFYRSRWGVDDLKVRSTNAGNLIRFSYRVVDPELANALNDKRNTPAMASERAHVVLQVPVMEKVGPLRQSMPPEAGKEYWMVFSNKGNFVRPGDRVNVMIGSFHADGLMVE
jgi:hypothetical protein